VSTLRREPRWWLEVAAGGAVGTAARAGLLWLAPTQPGAWPATIFAENVLGALLLGLLLGRLERSGAPQWLRSPFFSIGALGSFTTFSNLAWDVSSTVPTAPVLAVGYAAASLLLGLAAAGAGWWLGRRSAR
jgi:fluoride exporter